LVKEVVFPVKVYASKNRKGKDYFVYKVTIPKKIAKELRLKKDDHLLLKASKAEWFHLLDWDEMQPTWAMLPDHMKTRIRESGLKVPETQIVAPTSPPLPIPTLPIRQTSPHHLFIAKNLPALTNLISRTRAHKSLRNEREPRLFRRTPIHNTSNSISHLPAPSQYRSNLAATERYIG
jgi:hypothetical protein